MEQGRGFNVRLTAWHSSEIFVCTYTVLQLNISTVLGGETGGIIIFKGRLQQLVTV